MKGIQAALAATRTDPARPAAPELILQCLPGEFKPGVIEVVAAFVEAAPPDHHRRIVGKPAELQFLFCSHLGRAACSEAHPAILHGAVASARPIASRVNRGVTTLFL